MAKSVEVLGGQGHRRLFDPHGGDLIASCRVGGQATDAPEGVRYLVFGPGILGSPDQPQIARFLDFHESMAGHLLETPAKMRLQTGGGGFYHSLSLQHQAENVLKHFMQDTQKSWISTHWQKMLAGAFWAALFVFYLLYSRQHNLGPLQAVKELAGFVRSSAYGPLIFVVLYTLRPIFLFSAALLTVGAGALFGPVWGVIYSIIGSNLGASLAYFIGRFFGDGLVDTENQESFLGKYSKRMRKRSFETVFLMRLLFLPYDLVNYLSGILRIHFGAFLLATALGSIPGTISFTLFGASSGLDSGSPKFDWRILAASVGIFVLSLAVSKWLRRREEERDFHGQ